MKTSLAEATFEFKVKMDKNRSTLKNNFVVRACLHEGGGPQVDEVTCDRLPHLTCKRDQI